MRNASYGGLIIAVLLACYLVNCFSPLRLEYDSIRYFALKDCLDHSCPPGFRAADDPHPYGYPFLLWLLSRIGLLHAFTIAFINLLYLAGALYFTGKLFSPAGQGRRGLLQFSGGRQSPVRLPSSGSRIGLDGRRLEQGVLLVLLSYPFIKFFAYPVSEMQYLFFSCGSLFFFRLYTDRGLRPGALILAILFACLAILTRTAGVVLLPALAAGLIWRHRVVLVRHWKIVVPVAVVVVAAAVVLVVRGPGLYMNSVRRAGPGWKVLLREHLAEWGQLAWNIPAGKIPGVGQDAVRWVMIVSGLLLICVVSYQLIRQRKKVALAAGVYLALYSVLIFYWPFFDVRFWIPAVPLMTMILLYGKYPGYFRLGVAVYVLMGLGAMAYSTYIAFDKHALARSQAGGRYRHEYEVFFSGKPSIDTAVKIDPYVLHVLETCR